VEAVRLDTGIWKCPICGFTAMSKKVVENHMRTAHNVEPAKSEIGKNEGSKGQMPRNPNPKYGGRKNGNPRQKGPNGKKKPVKTRNDVMKELYHDYTFELLHNKKAIVYVQWGNEVREFRGLVHARDPYTVLLDTDEGERWIILKGQIIAYKIIKEK